jgi:hypothetical protein
VTLADFARQHGITPNHARQLKARGKIVTCDGGFAFAEGVTPRVTDESAVTGTQLSKGDALHVNVVTVEHDNSVTVLRPDEGESQTETIAPQPCPHDEYAVCPACWGKVDTENLKLETQAETGLESCSPVVWLSPEQVAARAAHERETDSTFNYFLGRFTRNPPPLNEAQLEQSAATMRQMLEQQMGVSRAEFTALQARVTKLERDGEDLNKVLDLPCQGCAELGARVTKLEGENAALLARLSEPDIAPAHSPLGARSNYSGDERKVAPLPHTF